MAFEELMRLTVGSGVVLDGHLDCTVTKITDCQKGKWYRDGSSVFQYEHDLRDVELSYVPPYHNSIQKIYMTFFTDVPECIHNKSFLDRLSVWDPFKEVS